jgi:hypothetical protein
MHGKSLCSYLYLKLAKDYVILFLFLSFMFFLMQNQRSGGQNIICGWGISTSGEGLGERGRKMNTVQKMCIHVCKCKNETL